jgi:hypothetical protein
MSKKMKKIEILTLPVFLAFGGAALWSQAATGTLPAAVSTDTKSEPASFATHLKVVKDKDVVLLRSPFHNGKDLVIRIELGENRQINLRSAALVDSSSPTNYTLWDGMTIHGNGDDVPAWNINGGYIGANHGVEGVELTCTGHGLTTADLGREWSDEKGRKLYLVKIVSPDTLWFLGENTAAAPLWKFSFTVSGNTLTGKSDGHKLIFTKNNGIQLRPACRIRKQAYLVDGKTALADGAVTTCNYFEIAEEYDIINPGAMLADVIAHPGVERNFIADHLDGVLRLEIVYRFYPNGSNVIETKAKALQSFNMGLALFVCTAPLTTHGNSYSREYYVPKTRPFVLEGKNFDFQKIQDYNEKPPAAINFSADGTYVEDSKNLPERFIQFLYRKENDRNVREVGFALGYSLIQGITRPQVRAGNVKNAAMLYTSLKSYPYAMDSKMGMIPAGMEFHCVGYRDYFSPQAYPNATGVYWHTEGDDIILYVDYHKNVDGDTIKLPPDFTGKKISIIEKTPSVTLHTADAIPATGIVLSVGNNYGYIVLKLR